MRLATFVPLVALVISACAHAAPPREARKAPVREWSVADYLAVEYAGGLVPSPDGTRVVWTKSIPREDLDHTVHHLFLSGLDGGFEVQLTRGTQDCSTPRWSPDSASIAFLSARPDPDATPDDPPTENAQLWKLDLRGGEPSPLTTLGRDVVDFGWKDASTILFAAADEKSLTEVETEERKDESLLVEDAANTPPVRLFTLSVDDGTVTRLTRNDDWIESVSVSPDGKWAFTVHQKSLSYEYDAKVPPEYYLTETETGVSSRVLDGGRFQVSSVQWEPKSEGLIVAYAWSNDPLSVEATVTRLARLDAASRSVTPIAPTLDPGISSDPGTYEATFSVGERGILAMMCKGAVNRPVLLEGKGDSWRERPLELDSPETAFNLVAVPGGKRALVLRAAPEGPDAWTVGKLDGARISDEEPLITPNEGLANRPYGRGELVTWKGARGRDIEGVLRWPVNYEDGRAYPLVVTIHGGPFGADMLASNLSWYDTTDYYASRGAFVFCPNYHGSSNYGLEFAESIANGKYYEYPVEDIEKGIDSLVARGLVDPERIALKGWSNGAILTLALIARSDRYAAAASGAGGAEWVADWAVCAFGASFARYYFGASPLDNPQRFLELSPFYNFAKVRTPLIVFHGDADTAVPAHHAWAQFRALQQSTSTPVRLVLFPGEEHHIDKLTHRRRKMEEEIAWFDRFLFRESRTPATAEFVRAGTPLARRLALASAAREGGAYGVLSGGKLIPETVRWNGIDVGRFEVTRAQFASFDPSRKFAPGEENLPATGVTFEQAREYCAWLSKLTGAEWALPDATTAGILDEAAAPAENTLDWWSGYSPRPEAAEKLRAEAARIGATAPLLLTVGTMDGAPDAAFPDRVIFDAGGNAAEWATDDDGKPTLRGGSADQPSDPKTPAPDAAPEYRGFRVVRR